MLTFGPDVTSTSHLSSPSSAPQSCIHKMGQEFELDFDFGSPEATTPASPTAIGDALSTSPTKALNGHSTSPTRALNGHSKPTSIPIEEDDVPDEDELLAMMEQDAQDNYARDVENLEAMKRKEDERKAAAARRRAAILAAMGDEPLKDITNTPIHNTQSQRAKETQESPIRQAQRADSPSTPPAQRNDEISMFEADFDFGEPTVASCESSLPSPMA